MLHTNAQGRKADCGISVTGRGNAWKLEYTLENVGNCVGTWVRAYTIAYVLETCVLVSKGWILAAVVCVCCLEPNSNLVRCCRSLVCVQCPKYHTKVPMHLHQVSIHQTKQDAAIQYAKRENLSHGNSRSRKTRKKPTNRLLGKVYLASREKTSRGGRRVQPRSGRSPLAIAFEVTISSAGKKARNATFLNRYKIMIYRHASYCSCWYGRAYSRLTVTIARGEFFVALWSSSVA